MVREGGGTVKQQEGVKEGGGQGGTVWQQEGVRGQRQAAAGWELLGH